MNGYLISDYKLSCVELLQSLIVSEYGLRHWHEANLGLEHKWGHRIIALIEFVPVLGQGVTVIEGVVFYCLYDPTVRNELSFWGSQNNHQGPVSREKVLSVVHQLNQTTEQGIEFDPHHVAQNLEAGMCSAMALDFAKEFFTLKKNDWTIGYSSSQRFLKKVSQLGSKFADGLSEERRIHQAAFNTIKVKNAVGIDAGRNKVQSLANLYNFKIDHSSPEISLDQNDCEKIFKEEMDRLPNGVYFTRAIWPMENEKLEFHGHSMIYVKDQFDEFFYDPNYGTTYMRNIDPSPIISKMLLNCYYQWNTSKVRFHRLTPR